VDLSTQIRDYAAAVDEAQKPMTLDEVTRVRLSSEQVRPINPAVRSAGPGPSRAWLAATTAAAVVLVLVGGTAWLTQMTGSDTSEADSVVPTTVAVTGINAQDQGAAASVTGHLLDSHYWEAPTLGPGAIDEGRMDMSDERLSGNVTFTYDGSEAWEPNLYLYSGTMLIENDAGTWEGTHFAADHHARPGIHGPLVMQLSGHGGYEGLSAILYRTIISDRSVPQHEKEESVDGMIYPGELPADRN